MSKAAEGAKELSRLQRRHCGVAAQYWAASQLLLHLAQLPLLALLLLQPQLTLR